MADEYVDSGRENSSQAIDGEQQDNRDNSQALATLALTPSLQSARTIRQYSSSFGELDLGCLVDELRGQIEDAIDGDLNRAEAMLVSQAHCLDAIFNHLARLAVCSEYLSSVDTYLKLGLRAQSQCRATLETLANIKNPRMSLNQTNIAQNQQVNIGSENKTRQNELLEKSDGERLEFRTAETPVNADSDVETVGAIHRAENA